MNPEIHMLWKVSAPTQSTASPWQPSLTKASEPSQMTLWRRPYKPVCNLLLYLLPCFLCEQANIYVILSELFKYNDLFPSEVMK